MLSPEAANFISTAQHDLSDDEIQEPGDVAEFDTTSSIIDPEVTSRIGSIDSRLRQSNMSILSRYKVSDLAAAWYSSL